MLTVKKLQLNFFCTEKPVDDNSEEDCDDNNKVIIISCSCVGGALILFFFCISPAVETRTKLNLMTILVGFFFMINLFFYFNEKTIYKHLVFKKQHLKHLVKQLFLLELCKLINYSRVLNIKFNKS